MIAAPRAGELDCDPIAPPWARFAVSYQDDRCRYSLAFNTMEAALEWAARRNIVLPSEAPLMGAAVKYPSVAIEPTRGLREARRDPGYGGATA
jgi:hypothetical protein